jgi:ribosomal protein S18 acetylase RimI-like enzyme
MREELEWRPPTLGDIPAITALVARCDAAYGTLESTLIGSLADRLHWDGAIEDYDRVVLQNGSVVAIGWVSTQTTASEERNLLFAFSDPTQPQLYEALTRWLVESSPLRAMAGASQRFDRVLASTTQGVPPAQLAIYTTLGFERMYVEHELVRGTSGSVQAPLGEFLPQRSFVARDNGQIVGFLFGLTLDDPDEWIDPAIRGIGWIDSIGVVPSHSGRGMATALIARAVEGFRAAGFEKVGLRVNEDNTRARRLYDYLGFTPSRKHVVYRREVPLTADLTPDK